MDAVAALLDQNRSNELRVFSPLAARQLAQAGYTRFEHLWSLPQEFVEPANLRRNGWSGVSILTLPNEQGEQGHQQEIDEICRYIVEIKH